MKRRTFLQQSILATAAWGIPMSRMNLSLGVALVGLGYYSRDLLAPALQLTKNCHLQGIVTGSPEKIPVWQKKYKIKDRHIYNYDNMHQLANDDGIDVVYIVLPTGLHAEYAIKAAEAGKHVWCEKPMARTADECQKIIDACNKNGVKLSIGYRMQHETNTRMIMKWAYEKPFGAIKTVTAEAGYYESRQDHWKMKKLMGGGAMYDMGVYPLNAARYACGEEPIAVTASHSTKRPKVFTEVDETTEFMLEFPSGAIAKGKTSFGVGMNLLNIECRRGWYYLEPFQAYSGVKGEASNGIVLKAMKRNQQAVQMDDDAMAILEDKAVLVPGVEGMKDIAIVEAIYQSAAIGERVEL
jgi:glucose-fructose oxidoreductase